ncbi:HAMP domain-containing histidine kinase [Flammeovirga kamogawensis]|uniref:histidine kinase n=2 Tax=Flammeovirga kamogawensis TaxID=373891 RepID=A0ABX8H022_9BACT|nr:HAMP domain-containing sensor histidine kinase [Flammeovirga kamogawensis]QWG09235.1 HAMP domain-containing histidine kinase [Flammeovirga kamogawensis]TRX70151.1 HAMP domain-containing histidine kinase [Flammeovirga kamogawensis]
MGLVIGITSLIYTELLVDELRQREYDQIDFFAKVQAKLATMGTEDNADVTFLLMEVIKGNDLIPVVLTDDMGEPISSKNIEIPSDLNFAQRMDYLKKEVQEMKKNYAPIKIDFTDGEEQYIYYADSKLVRNLRFAPMIQLSVLAILALAAYLVFSTSRRAEQNQVWAGLAKETAHQLGTPISSLVAWIEYFKTDEDFDQSIIEELQKDITRLEMITARFSNIGSEPVLKPANLESSVRGAVEYMSKRISTKVSMNVHYNLEGQADINISLPLFEWVVENLCRNAVDAMNGVGRLDITMELTQHKTSVTIDVKDTGKGIPKNKLTTVFNPGYTTKKRGWGLGLTLVKRIVEDYHKGKIIVLESTPGEGTTFRITMPIIV